MLSCVGFWCGRVLSGSSRSAAFCYVEQRSAKLSSALASSGALRYGKRPSFGWPLLFAPRNLFAINCRGMKVLLFTLILILGSSLSGYGQERSAPAKLDPSTSFLLELAQAEQEARIYGAKSLGYPEYAGAAKRVQELYAKAASDPVLLDALLVVMFKGYSEAAESAKSAPQASQAADDANVRLQFILIQQNARIIRLLEQLNRH